MEQNKRCIRIYFSNTTELRKQAWRVYEGVDAVFKGKIKSFVYDSQEISPDVLHVTYSPL